MTYEDLVKLGAQPVPDAPGATGAAAPPGGGLTFEQLTAMGAKPVEGAPVAAPATAPARPSLLDRAGATLSGIGHTIAGGARAVGESVAHPIDTITDPSRRRQLERGLDDMITLGYGQKAADYLGRKLGDAPAQQLGATAASDQQVAPEFRQLGNVVGMFSPGATSGAAHLGGSVVGKLASGIAAPTTALGRAALGGAKAIGGYEATAAPLAGLSADAAGRRGEAALEAATNPVGLGLSGIAGAAHGLAPEDLRGKLIEGAKERATKDIAKDIISAEGPKAKMTDQARVKDVSDRLFSLTQENPELRSVWRESARQALPKIEEAKRQAAKPLDGKYDQVDQITGGGIRLGDVLSGFDAAENDARKTAMGQPQAERIRKVRDSFVKAYGKPGFDPTIEIDGVPAGTALQALEKAKASGVVGMDPRIEQIKELASGGLDENERIPTAQFRQEVTALHKTADLAPGQIEGAARQEALTHLYEIGKGIIDKHLDESGLPDADLKALRKANDQYFLLSRAEAAIESRGIKEESRTGGSSHSWRSTLTHAFPIGAAAVEAYHNPSTILPMAAAYGATKALPAIRSRLDWRLANMSPAGQGLPLPPGIAARAVGRQAPEVDGANLAAALAAQQQQQR